ncbi:histone H1 [archaeon]|nr:histone H1 [archaeon]|tara:strand:+ start:3261 stop:3455 length:195 start_codon:yes stop_codon:yes gene_type:complete
MSNILDRWTEIKVLVESLELDVHKNANGNASAGVRVRKGLRSLKKDVGDLVKLSIAEDKSKKSD